MVYYAIQLNYYPTEQKKAQKILFEKRRKQDFRLVRSQQVISLLNYIGKVVNKIVAKKLSHYDKDYFKLHPGQIKDQKKRSAIDIVARLIRKVHEKQEEKKLQTVLFIDIKEVFNLISNR